MAANCFRLADAVLRAIPQIEAGIDADAARRIRGELGEALSGFDAQKQVVDPALVQMIKLAYPADKDGIEYGEDEIRDFVWSAWANGWSPIPADGDCYPLRTSKGVIAGDTFGMLRDAFNELIGRKGVQHRVEFYAVMPDEKGYYRMGEEDVAFRCVITTTDRADQRNWYAALERVRDLVGYKATSKDAREVVADIERMIGTCPPPVVTSYEAVGIFWADEHDTDIPLKKYRGMTPARRARDRALKRAYREILPFAGARRANTVIVGQLMASEDEIQERELVARGHAVTQEEARSFIEDKNRKAADRLYRDNETNSL